MKQAVLAIVALVAILASAVGAYTFTPSKIITHTQTETLPAITETTTLPPITVTTTATVTVASPSNTFSTGVLKLGQTAMFSELKVTVLSAKRSKSYEWYSSTGTRYEQSAGLGIIFVLVDAEIQNIGNVKKFTGNIRFSVVDSQSYRYDIGPYLGTRDAMGVQNLFPNQRMKGTILFQVPETANGLKVNYEFSSYQILELATWAID